MVSVFIHNYNHVKEVKDYNNIFNLINHTTFNFEQCDVNELYPISKNNIPPPGRYAGDSFIIFS